MRTMLGSIPASIVMLITAATSGHAQVLPLEMIRTAYETIAKDQWLGKTDPSDVGVAPKSLTAKWFTTRFVGALQKNAKCWATGKGGPIVSIWYATQDHDIKDSKIVQAEDSKDKQVVRADFSNFNKPEKRDFIFKKAGNDWRIDEVSADGKGLYALMMKGCAS